MSLLDVMWLEEMWREIHALEIRPLDFLLTKWQIFAAGLEIIVYQKKKSLNSNKETKDHMRRNELEVKQTRG